MQDLYVGVLDYGNDLETYIIVYIIIFEKLYRFFGKGLLLFLEKEIFSKSFVVHSHFLVLRPSRFKLLKVRIDEDSWHIPVKVAASKGMILTHTTVLYLCPDIAGEMGSISLIAHFCLRHFRFKFIHIFHITIHFGFVTFLVSANTAQFGVLVDIPGRGVSVLSPKYYFKT